MLKLEKRSTLGGKEKFFPSQEVGIAFSHVDIKIDQGPGQHFVSFVITSKEGVDLNVINLKTPGEIHWACTDNGKLASGGMGLDKHELALLNWNTAFIAVGKNNSSKKEIYVQYK